MRLRCNDEFNNNSINKFCCWIFSFILYIQSVFMVEFSDRFPVFSLSQKLGKLPGETSFVIDVNQFQIVSWHSSIAIDHV